MNINRNQKWVALAFAPLLAIAQCAYAQDTSTNNTQNTGANNASPNTLGQVAPANQVYGHEVMSSDNQQVGKLNNLVVDLESGRILYGVIAAGNNRVAVPPEIFTQTQASNNEIHINATKQKVDGAPQFGPVDKPGQLGSAAFVSKVYSYFGQSPWWQGSSPANVGSFNNVHKANKVAGMKVQNVNNAPMGSIKGVAVDLPAGRVVVLTLAPDSSLNLGNNIYPMPPQAFTMSQNQNNLASNIDATKLAAAPHFTENNWPNLSDPNYVSQIYQYYGKQTWFGGQPTGR